MIGFDTLWLLGAVLLWVPFSVIAAKRIIDEFDMPMEPEDWFAAVFFGGAAAVFWPLTFVIVAIMRVVKRAIAEIERAEQEADQ